MLVVLLFLGGCYLLGLLILGRDIFWLVGFLSDAVFVLWWFLVVFWVWFLFRFCWFLSFWMLWAVVFILGRWLVWRFGFCGVFVILQSFASLYRFNFASFYIFCWLVNSSAVNVNGSYFYFFKSSWMVLALCLVFLGCFVVFFYYFLCFPPFLSFCQMFLFFVVFSLDFL